MRRKRFMNRVLSVLLTASMAVSMMSAGLQAEELSDSLLDVVVEESADEPDAAAAGESDGIVLDAGNEILEVPSEDNSLDTGMVTDIITEGDTIESGEAVSGEEDAPFIEMLEEIVDEPSEDAAEEISEENGTDEAEESPDVAEEDAEAADDTEVLPEIAVEDVDVTEDPEQVTLDMASYNATNDTHIITVEKYDADGNGTFLLGPTEVPYVYEGDAANMLSNAGLEPKYDDDGWGTITITGIKDSSMGDGYLDNNADGGTWFAVKDGSKASWGYLSRKNTAPGSIYRYIYTSNYDRYVKGTSSAKNSLIRYIAGLTEEQTTGAASEAYQTAVSVLLNGNAADEDVTAAQTALDDALNPKIPATKITVEPTELILGAKETAVVKATVEPANTTDTLTWSSEDPSIVTVDSNGKVKASYIAGTTNLVVKANDDVEVKIPVTVNAGTYVTISVEVYDKSDRNYNRNGRYLVEPTRISMTTNRSVREILADAVGGDNLRIDYDDYGRVTGVKDSTQSDGYLDVGDIDSSFRWGFLSDGVLLANGGGASVTQGVAPGQTVRVIFACRGADYHHNGLVPKYVANKDELLAVMAGMNEKQKATDEYAAAKAVALYGDAKTAEVENALAALKALPENPMTISDKEAEVRMGSSVSLMADGYADWSIEDESVASLVSKNDQMAGTSYCTITGKKPGTTTVYATDENGFKVSCKVTVVAPVYFEFKDGSKQQMAEDGSFTLTSLDEGRFVLNLPQEGETAVFESEDKISVWNPVDKEWNSSFHWWVDDETGTWQPAAASLEKPITVTTANLKTQFTIHYVQVKGITDLKAYVDGTEVTMDDPYKITGTMWTEHNYYNGVAVTVKGMKDGQEITIPVQALSYETSDPNYNFRFIGNKMIINRAGEATMTISLKQLSGTTEGAPSVSFKAVCEAIPATGMYVDVDDANQNVCYIDQWQPNGEHYVGVRPGTWDAATGDRLNDGYHITFEPYNTTQRDVKWEVAEGADVAYHTDLHSDGIVPLKAGTVTFKVTNIYNEDISQLVTVTFKYKNPLENAVAEKNTYTMGVGDSVNLNISFTPSNATEQRFNWTYSQDGIVAVSDKIQSDESGMETWTTHTIRALSAGVVTVTGTPMDDTAGCKPIIFTVYVGTTQTGAEAQLSGVKAVESANTKIEAIGEVSLASETAIKEARAAYDALTDAQKALISADQLKTLTDAEAKLADLKKADEAAKAEAAAKEEAAKQDARAAESVNAKIAAIGEVTIASETAIKAARKAYDGLTGAQKALISADQLKVLTAAEAKLTELKKADEAAKAEAAAKEEAAAANARAAEAVGKKITAIGTVTLKSETVIQEARAAYEKLTYEQKALLVKELEVLKAAETKLAELQNIPATKVKLSKTSVSVNKGKKVTLKATMTPSGTTDKLTWSSSDTKIAKVSSRGVVTGVAKGTAIITVAASSGKSAACVVTVKVPSTKVKLNKSSVSVNKGKTVTLKATMTPGTSTDKLTWSSSNTKVAKVSSKGVVTGVKKGTATITVKTTSGKKATCKVTVKVPSTKVKLNKTTAKVKVGKTVTLKATMTPGSSTDKLTWRSSNTKVAKVSSKGKVTGVKAGTATITVKTSSGKKATCKVTVK